MSTNFVADYRNQLSVQDEHKTRFLHADHLIMDQDKEPNETSEIKLLLPESCQQSPPV